MTPDPTGAYGPRPDAGQRTDPAPWVSSSEGRPGGLMALGTRVHVTIYSGDQGWTWTGKLVDKAASPDGYIALADVEDRPGTERAVIFTGPGVVITDALPTHPAIG